MEDEWMMTATRVAKYNPEYMTDRGYIKDEWTEYCDVGKTFEGEVLTYEEYERVEQKYINATLLFLSSIGCNRVRIEHAEKDFKHSDFRERDLYLYELYKKLDDNVSVPLDELDDVMRLILRAYLWAELACISVGAYVRILGGFYMFFNKDNGLDEETIKKIKELGLYVT